MAPGAFALLLLSFQAAGDSGGAPQRIEYIYRESLQTTEVRVRLVPVDPDGKPARITLTFQAFFPGRPARVGSAIQPPTGKPARLLLTAQAFPLTFVIPELSLRLLIDGRTIPLTADGDRYRNIPCLVAREDYTPTGVEADLSPAVLQSLITARSVRGEALGFPIELTPADQRVLADFAARIGLSIEDR